MGYYYDFSPNNRRSGRYRHGSRRICRHQHDNHNFWLLFQAGCLSVAAAAPFFIDGIHIYRFTLFSCLYYTLDIRRHASALLLRDSRLLMRAYAAE